MIKRWIALVLVLCMALSLVGCGKKQEQKQEKPIIAVEKDYTSENALSIYSAIDAAKKMKDFRFRYLVNTLDEESNDAKSNRLAMEGVCFASTKQASIKVKLEGKELTELVIDGNACYLNVKTCANTLAELMATLSQEDGKELSEELSTLAKGFETEFVRFELKEDIWTSLEGDTAAQVKSLLNGIYESVRKETEPLVTTEETTCTLSLTGESLLQTLRQLTEHMLGEQKNYEGFFVQWLQDNFSTELDELGWMPEDIVGNRWEDWNELDEKLGEQGETEDWSVSFVTCGDEQSGYTMDVTRLMDKHLNNYLELRPATAEPVSVPEQSVNHLDCVENLTYLLSDWQIYNNYAYQEDDYSSFTDEYDDGEGNAMLEQFLAQGDDEEESDTVETQAISGTKDIVLTAMTTEDGKALNVPILAKYNRAEVGNNEQGVNDVFISTDGYALEYTVLEGQELTNAAQRNAKLYESNYKNDWGYEITNKTSAVKTSADGKVAMAGMSYYDSDEEQDVTVITGAFAVDGTEEQIVGFDLFVYSKQVTEKECKAMQELFTYLGVEAPIELAKN